jgi:hypothetical protein
MPRSALVHGASPARTRDFATLTDPCSATKADQAVVFALNGVLDVSTTMS